MKPIYSFLLLISSVAMGQKKDSIKNLYVTDRRHIEDSMVIWGGTLDSNTIIYGNGFIFSPHYDTIPCIMLVSDTGMVKGIANFIPDPIQPKHGSSSLFFQVGHWEENWYYPIQNVWQMRGYEVMEKKVKHHPQGQERLTDDAITWNNEAYDDIWFEHTTYLDADKKPLKIFVWLSKSLK